MNRRNLPYLDTIDSSEYEGSEGAYTAVLPLLNVEVLLGNR